MPPGFGKNSPVFASFEYASHLFLILFITFFLFSLFNFKQGIQMILSRHQKGCWCSSVNQNYDLELISGKPFNKPIN